MVFNIKLYFTWKEGHVMETPPAVAYLCFVYSSRQCKVGFLISVLNDLNIILPGIGYAYLNVYTKENDL
jgi:hypothetical protein